MIKYDILICGIGGQGVISLGTVLKLAAISEGLTVIGAERRGGAQREGIVTSNIRYRGTNKDRDFDERDMAASGLIPVAGCDMMIAMEPLEALRHAKYLNEDTVVIVNDFPLIPVHVRIGECTYPEKETIYSNLKKFTNKVYTFNINDISRTNFNTLRLVNTISLGLAHSLGQLPVSEKSILLTVKNRFPDFEKNRKAFYLGRETADASQ